MSARRRRSAGGLGPLVVLLCCALAVIAATTVEVGADPTEPTAPVPVAGVAPASGWAYCPATADEGETATLVLAPATSEPTTVTVVRYTAQGRVADDPVEVPPGEQHVVTLEGADATRPVAVRWHGAAAIASWAVEGEDAAAAPCEDAARPEWHVTGFDTTAQNRGILHLFNPYPVDAVVRVTFGTPDGPVALVLTDNVLVPANSAARLELGEYEPQRPDLAATVETLSGRVVAQGEVRLAPTANQPGPTGRALLGATPEPGHLWALAIASSGEQADSWVSVYNPGTREAAVQVRVSDPDPDSTTLLGEVSVPAGGVVRVPLAGTSTVQDFGVTVQAVTDLPVVAAVSSTMRLDEREGLGASRMLAADDGWALAGGATAGRVPWLALYNPGGQAVRVTVDAGAATPEEWGEIDLGANQRVALDLRALGDRPAVALRADGDGPFVAQVRSRALGGPLLLWSVSGLPSRSWEARTAAPPAVRDPELSTRSAITGAPEEAAPDVSPGIDPTEPGPAPDVTRSPEGGATATPDAGETATPDGDA